MAPSKPYLWLWETLASELGPERAAAIRQEYEDRQRAESAHVEQARASAELPALRQQLAAALRKGEAGETKKLQAMIAKRERVLEG